MATVTVATHRAATLTASPSSEDSDAWDPIRFVLRNSELLGHILSFVGQPARTACTLVCRQWRDVARSVPLHITVAQDTAWEQLERGVDAWRGAVVGVSLPYQIFGQWQPGLEDSTVMRERVVFLFEKLLKLRTVTVYTNLLYGNEFCYREQWRAGPSHKSHAYEDGVEGVCAIVRSVGLRAQSTDWYIARAREMWDAVSENVHGFGLL
eukprot:comp6371_c0_seq1/m.2172 comp6371_c0_seq1/g.2172  ORF comp6371_c0_seq1/g.2172 comp6371_c0_seq1/m.2172 type:complete len:209 (-) comp6371_c0_seq1:436-1062(-)